MSATNTPDKKKEDDTGLLIPRKTKRKLDKKLSFQMEARKSALPGKLAELDEDVQLQEVMQKRYDPEKRNSMRLKTEEFLFQDVKELDSDEERCDLVDDKNGHDRHFFCQK